MQATGFDAWALSLIVFLPLVGALITMLIPRENEDAIKGVALLATLASFAVTVVVLFRFNYHRAEGGILQFNVNKAWIDVINAHYHVGIDGISLPLLALSSFITV